MGSGQYGLIVTKKSPEYVYQSTELADIARISNAGGTNIDQIGLVSSVQVVHHRCLVQMRQFCHIICLVEFRRIDLIHLVGVDLSLL